MIGQEPVLVVDDNKTIAQTAAERYGMPEIGRADFLKCESYREANYPRADPLIAVATTGAVYVTYQHPAVLVLHRSDDGGRTWQKVDVTQRPPFCDYGGVLAFGATHQGSLIVLYTGRTTEPPVEQGSEAEQKWREWARTGKTHFARSDDGGVTWRYLHEVDKAGFDSVQGWGQALPLADGSMIATATRLRIGQMHQDHIWQSRDQARTFTPYAAMPERSAETHLLQLPSGRLLAAIRTVYFDYDHPRNKLTAISHSDDLGRSWSAPRLVTSSKGDTPGELLRLPDGRIVLLYCHRYEPPQAGIYGLVSEDEGQTWSKYRLVIRLTGQGKPAPYPASTVLPSGNVLTICGQQQDVALQAVRWRLPKQ